MNKLSEAMKNIKSTHGKAFVPYIMAGDGGLGSLEEKLVLLEQSGATAIEIGIPFSDPVADGPTIQEAGIRALELGVTLPLILTELKNLKDKISVPLIVMTYLNPILAYGIKGFVEASKAAGITGLIIPDLPIEEENLLLPFVEAQNIELIRLVTLTTPIDRIEEIASRGNGFLYCVTVKGITGVRQNFNEDLKGFLKNVQAISPIPVLAGFGISSAEQAAELARYCDGVVVGSKIVQALEAGNHNEITELIQDFKRAIDFQKGTIPII